MSTPAHQRRAEAALAAAGVDWRRIRYARPEAQGETAAYLMRPAARATARVVVAHGAGNDALYPLLHLHLALVCAGFEVFAFDLDGNGWQSTTRFAPETATGAVHAAVRAAGNAAGTLPVHLLGHSLGGALVLHALAADPPPHAISAAVISAPIEVRFAVQASLGELRAFLRPATLAQRQWYGLWGLVPAAGHLKRRAFPWRIARPVRGAFGYVGAVEELLRALDPDAVAPNIHLPTLLIYGARDGMVPLEQGARLARRIPRARLVTLPGAAHWDTLLRPEATAEVARWFAQHTAASAAEEKGAG